MTCDWVVEAVETSHVACEWFDWWTVLGVVSRDRWRQSCNTTCQYCQSLSLWPIVNGAEEAVEQEAQGTERQFATTLCSLPKIYMCWDATSLLAVCKFHIGGFKVRKAQKGVWIRDTSSRLPEESANPTTKLLNHIELRQADWILQVMSCYKRRRSQGIQTI